MYSGHLLLCIFPLAFKGLLWIVPEDFYKTFSTSCKVAFPCLYTWCTAVSVSVLECGNCWGFSVLVCRSTGEYFSSYCIICLLLSYLFRSVVFPSIVSAQLWFLDYGLQTGVKQFKVSLETRLRSTAEGLLKIASVSLLEALGSLQATI